jgi:long-subunit fatty acid transport protein
LRLAVGLSYEWSEQLRIDFGYAHVFADRENIDLTRSFYDGSAAAGSVTTRARANLFINDFALRVSYRF